MDALDKAGGLVITRRPGQSFLIGDSRVTVLPGRGSRLRILVNAPRSVKVLRAELLDKPAGDRGEALLVENGGAT